RNKSAGASTRARSPANLRIDRVLGCRSRLQSNRDQSWKIRRPHIQVHADAHLAGHLFHKREYVDRRIREPSLPRLQRTSVATPVCGEVQVMNALNALFSN